MKFIWSVDTAQVPFQKLKQLHWIIYVLPNLLFQQTLCSTQAGIFTVVSVITNSWLEPLWSPTYGYWTEIRKLHRKPIPPTRTYKYSAATQIHVQLTEAHMWWSSYISMLISFIMNLAGPKMRFCITPEQQIYITWLKEDRLPTWVHGVPYIRHL